ncbi:MAG TPA: ABC transporter permease [Verrucomicrobiae bacterium]|nr:ABC transporter permease [Verrucomicrobiae bacterium]
MKTQADNSLVTVAAEQRSTLISAGRAAAQTAAAAPKRRMRFYVIAFYLLLFGTWQAVISLHWAPDYMFPSPAQVFKRLYELVTEGFMLPSIQATLYRMAIGFSIAASIGLVLGLVMGMSAVAHACLKSLFLGLQTLPTAAWAPLSLLIFGLKDTGIYFVIVMSAAPAIAIATADGILNIPPIYLRAARTLGTPGLMMPFRIIVPAALPAIVTGIKLGWTLGWHGAVSAELIKSVVGLGFLLNAGRELNDAAQVFAIMIVTILFGLLLDRFLFGIFENRIRKRWGLTKETVA